MGRYARPVLARDLFHPILEMELLLLQALLLHLLVGREKGLGRELRQPPLVVAVALQQGLELVVGVGELALELFGEGRASAPPSEG